jgi:biopolymer transport protein ExbD
MRPSKRRHRVHSDVELKLIPVMSLLVVLVPMLLQTAVFEQTAAISMNLPSADEVRYLEDVDPADLGDTVTLAMTDAGFLLISGEATLGRVPLVSGGGFDYPALDKALAEAKQRFARQEAIVLLVEDQVFYDDVVHTMDRCRPYFPAVSLADRVEAPEE